MIKKDLLFSLKLLLIVGGAHLFTSVAQQDFSYYTDWKYYAFLVLLMVGGGAAHHYFELYKNKKKKESLTSES
ncbi:hypothetical protein [Halocola ammonii]